ncbi:MAG: hypothetical protein V7631_3840 [Massilia sp.]|jgi:hypothetical protein
MLGSVLGAGKVAGKATTAIGDAVSATSKKSISVAERGGGGGASTTSRSTSEPEDIVSGIAETPAVALTPYGTTLADEIAALRNMSMLNTNKEGTVFNARISAKPYIIDGDVNGLIQQLDVSTGGRPLGFWSGNLDAAMREAGTSGVALMETTPGGTVVNNWRFLNDRFTWDKGGEQFWGGLSSKYASGASGNIHVWQTPEKAINSLGELDWQGGTVWQKYEEPIIEKLQLMGEVDQIERKLVEPTLRNSPARLH